MPQILFEEPNLEGNNSFSHSPLANCAGLEGPCLPHFVERSFPQLFEDQVERHPAKLAVVCGGETITFAELNERANQLAHYLRSLGITRESVVGICIDRSLEMAIGILGILKAGGAYLPLDPDYPGERLAFMIKDAGPSVVVTKSGLSDLVPDNTSPVVCIDSDWAAISAQPNGNVSDNQQPNDLAYVIYTSGSTGQPKGVMIEHGNLANYLLALNRELEIQSDDLYLHIASIAFSSSRRQLMLPLSQGATVAIASSEQRKDPLALFQMIKHRGVTVIDAVPSFWRSCTTIVSELDDAARRELLDNKVRLMLSASEPLLSDIPRTWAIDFRHPARHVHMFGQTETAGIVCVNPISIGARETEVSQIPIGNPIANTEILVLDEEMRPSPLGVAGELYIGGAGVGRGYLNRPELTNEKFVAHPLNRDGATRLYRTGDWARLREDRRLEFAGRRDQLIKLRGFRVELGEVEAALASHPAIRENAVIARARNDSNDSNTRLVAFFVCAGSVPDTKELREFLASRLPQYAIPSAFVQMEVLPLSANGKVDRLALIDSVEPTVQRAIKYVAPHTKIETQLAQIWRELLRDGQVGVDDNFFELGGNSLLAGQAIARVRRMFKVEAPITWLFESPRVGELAARIETTVANGDMTAAAQIPRTSRAQSLPLSFSQHRLWFLDQLDPDYCAYNLAHAFEIEGSLDAEALHKALNTIVARHEILRTRFVSVEGTPRQQIDLPAEIDWRLIELESLPRQQSEAESQRLLQEAVRQPFDLSTGPLLRAMLVRLSANQHVLALTMHHIISDGWSTKVFAGELENLYCDFVAGHESSLPELPIQYADFAHWQREGLHNGLLDSQTEYWKRQMSNAPSVLELPTDHPRSVPESYRGARATIRLSATLSSELRRLGRSHDATLFMTLLAAFNCLLARYSGQSDIVVGSPIAGRNRVETEPLIGFFVNTLALRATVLPTETVRQLLARVRETALSAYENQDMPFEKLVSELQHERDIHNPIFQVMFVLQNGKRPAPKLGELSVRTVELHSGAAKFDLALEVIDDHDGLDISIEYSTNLFEAGSIDCMLNDFQLVLKTFVANPDQQLSAVPTLSWKPKHAPTKIAPSGMKTETVFVAPRTPIEEKLASIWTEVLNLDRVGIDDNFFALGGHSLMATQVIARVRSTFNYELPLRRLFEMPTIAGLASAICENQVGQTEAGEFAALLAELEGLSDDEALSRLQEQTHAA